ncbi:MAG: phytanoyl-CoA dioxygenase family protein [Isosphaeraceae bacterium]
MPSFVPSLNQKRQFDQDGFLVVNGLFDEREVTLIRDLARADQELMQSAVSRRDGDGGTIRLTVVNELGDDVYATIVRSRRVAGAMAVLLEDEVYHYHHKVIFKDARTGGAWEWHQDYGYWYDNGCLFPDMGSCMIALDPATRANGCLQVLRGSHKMGRVNHGPVGDQTGADPERTAAALERLERVDCVMSAGSAIFFHGNLLHRSDRNESDHPRWAFIACYNTKHNDPYKESRHPRYRPLHLLDDAAVFQSAQHQWNTLQVPR